MSYLAKKQRSFLLRCIIRCQQTVMFVLIFTLMVLLSGLGLSIYYDEIPIPERLLKVVNQQLEKQGLVLKFDTISLDFSGNLLIQNARVSFAHSTEPALEADLLYIGMNYPAFLLGKVPFDNLRLANARLYSPAIVSPTGKTDPLIENANMEVAHKWTNWNLDLLTARIFRLDLSASGDISAAVAKMAQPKGKERQPLDLYSMYLQLTRILADSTKHLQSLESPQLDLRFSSPDKSTFTVDVTAGAEKFALPGQPVGHQLRAHAKMQVLPEIALVQPLHVSVVTVDHSPLQIQVKGVELLFNKDQPIPDLDSLFPVKVQGTSGNIDYQENRVNQVVFDGQILNMDEATGTVIASLYDGAFLADLHGNWKERTVDGSLTGSINLERILDRPEFDHLWKLRWSKQHKPLYLDVDFNYPGSLETATARFRAETRDIDVIKTPFQWARARGTLEGTSVDVSRLEGGGYGNDLLCTFRQDLGQPFYRFTMVGRFRPHDIDVWWRDWWEKTFDYLEIKGELPWMDLSLRNAFKYKKQLTLFGYVAGENINLKGMHFDKASARMFIRPNYIDALELHLVRPEGQATGQFQRYLVMSELKNVMVDIDSSLDLEPSMELFGESGLRIIEPYTWQGNPSISLVGEFNFENNTHWQDLLFKIDTDNPMTLYNFPFDNLHVSGHYDHGNVLLEDVAFGFAGGRGTGEASFLRQDEQSFLLFDFDVTDAELQETLKRLGTVKKTEPTPKTELDKEKKDAEPLEGKLKVHASGISPAGYGIDRVMAKGHLEITEGNLAQIPLFGPLSGLLPFTKLRLNTAKSFFAWDNGKMTFPDLVMTGKTARLEGLGDYYISNSNLDFQVRLFLLRETNIPLVSNIIMPIFDPFSQMATVNLKGTLQKPEWRFALSPFNLFDKAPGPAEEEFQQTLPDFEFRK